MDYNHPIKMVIWRVYPIFRHSHTGWCPPVMFVGLVSPHELFSGNGIDWGPHPVLLVIYHHHIPIVVGLCPVNHY